MRSGTSPPSLRGAGNPAGIAVWAALASFAAYFAMYAFRKPFVAGVFPGEFGSTGIALKTSYVLAQIVGYTLSKYIGVKVCSEAAGARRGVLLVAFVLWAELALVGFGLLQDILRHDGTETACKIERIGSVH